MAFCEQCQVRRTKRGNTVCYVCAQPIKHPKPIGRPRVEDYTPEQIEARYQAALREIRWARVKNQAA